MFYRVCIPDLDSIYALREPLKWEHQVHAEYPKASGSFVEALSTLSSALLANPAPNISVVIEPMTEFAIDLFETINLTSLQF